MRKSIVLGLGLALVACANSAPMPPSGKPEPEVLLIRSQGRLVAFDPQRGTTVTIGSEAVRIPGTSAFVSREGERLIRTDAATGNQITLSTTAAGYRLVAVSASGRSIGLAGETRNGRTPVLVVNGEDGQARRFSLAGRVVPEAFSTDDGRLFLIHYLAGASRYRLLELNLADGAVAPLGARVKQPAPVEMVGAGRAQVASPDGRILYTLYTRQPAGFPHGRRPGQTAPADGTAFVHVLNLEAGTAHCVELPESFGPGAIATDAMAISPEGARLFVVDGKHERAAVISTATLRTESVGFIAVPDTSGRISAAVDGGGSVFVARGATIAAYHEATLTRTRTWVLPSASSDVAVGRSGRLFVGAATGIYALDPGGQVVEQLRSGGAELAGVLG